MAKGINRAQVLGHVGKEPDVSATRGGTLVARFSVATPEREKDSAGQWQDRTEWHNVVALGRTAEIVRDYVKKGSRILIEGKMQTQSWEDKQSGKKMYRMEILCFDVVLLDASRSSRGDYGFDSQFEGDKVPF